MNFAGIVALSLRSGHALHPRHRDDGTVTGTGSGSTYRRRNAVQTNPATSVRLPGIFGLKSRAGKRVKWMGITWRDFVLALACVTVLVFGSIGNAHGQDDVRFSRTGCGSIVDRATQLEWYIGPDTNMSWLDSLSWNHRLRECGGDWQMPSLAQLRALFDVRYTAGTGYYTRGRYWPAHINPVFSGIGGGSWVWANDLGRRAASEKPAFNFNQGVNVVLETGRDYSGRAFAVRHADTRTAPITRSESEVPVVIQAKPSAQTACRKGVVIDLDPHGDGFLAVKAGPGLQFLRIDKLYNGEKTYLCIEVGDWYGIVYTKENQACDLDRAWSLSLPYTGLCRSGWVHRRWIKPIPSAEIENASPAPAREPLIEHVEIEQLLTAARKQNNPGILKEFLLSNAGVMGREQIKKAYFDLSDPVQSHSFGVLDTLKIYEKPDIQGRVMRDDSVGKTYILFRREGDFDYVEYEVNEYGYIYHGFLD